MGNPLLFILVFSILFLSNLWCYGELHTIIDHYRFYRKQYMDNLAKDVLITNKYRIVMLTIGFLATLFTTFYMCLKPVMPLLFE